MKGLILNEHSYSQPASSMEDGKACMQVFCHVIAALRKEVGPSPLRVQENFNHILIADDYPLAKWRNDQSVDLETRRLFTSLSTQSPFLDETMSSERDRTRQCDVVFNGISIEAFTIAYLFDCLPVSFIFNGIWDLPIINALFIAIGDNEDINEEPCNIHHFARVDHVTTNAQHIIDVKSKVAASGETLWRDRKSLFPYLAFCDNTKNNIIRESEGSSLLNQIKKKLFALNTIMQEWTGGVFDSSTAGILISQESESTLARYEKTRTFICPDGVERVFSWHCRVTPANWRIHFFPVRPNLAYIGYIGPKLPTTKYRT